MTRSVLLWGMPGAGKSTVGRVLSAQMGLPFLDTDGAVESRTGLTPGELVRRDGEAAFRRVEGEVVRAALAGPRSVVALGGGALLDRSLRLEALRQATVVRLDAPLEVLESRIRGTDRPLASVGLGALAASRAEAYAETHGTVRSDGPAEAVAHVVASLAAREPVVVALGARTYPVWTGDDALLGPTLTSLDPTAALGVSDAQLAPLVRPWFEAAVGGVRGVFHVTPRGEAAKDAGVLVELWRVCLGADLDRRSVLLGIGGGVTTDLACFVAGTFARGVRWVSVPTSLLGMVDAGLGGKGAVDLDGVKNPVGVIHQPSAVVASVERLATEPERSLRSGLAEVVKSGLLGDAGLVDLVEAEVEALGRRDLDVLRRVVSRAGRVKAHHVSLDEREAGPRKLLNLGHTFGHAVESELLSDGILHGEAVSIGLVAALEAGVRLGVTDAALPGRIESLLGRLGLPTRVPAEVRDRAVKRLGTDKKRHGGRLTLALVQRPGEGVLHDLGLDEARDLFV